MNSIVALIYHHLFPGATNHPPAQQGAAADSRSPAGRGSPLKHLPVRRREMPTFVALLRGVNVGKAKRVPMAELRVLLSGLGYTAWLPC